MAIIIIINYESGLVQTRGRSFGTKSEERERKMLPFLRGFKILFGKTITKNQSSL